MKPAASSLRWWLALALALVCMHAAAREPSDADIEKLLAASRAQSMLSALIPQMEAMQRQQFEQVMSGKDLTAEQRQEVERIQAKTSEIVRRSLSWEEMRPLYIDVYKKTFTRDDVRAITKFYESSAGKSLLDKTPLLMQNLMAAVQLKMGPMLEELQAEIQAASEQPAPAPPVSPPQKRRKR
ncbi:DUF2059 domain-containing protein [Pseudoxanthomonas dokdonensis]|uniref:DUF2059 domain-containing protein n=1 Tax=Pseudoxanthomonas dokdonensis TaxID=344882 RepID=A0A0R0D0U4_9GAMM|nr:DUF2059 domain-containing protein [Pseudoxanthomonas dokdonensis]KRG72110.1 hypothetical protein ABB29_00160 [Pseudoxanthomonas dokdonensis]